MVSPTESTNQKPFTVKLLSFLSHLHVTKCGQHEPPSQSWSKPQQPNDFDGYLWVHMHARMHETVVHSNSTVKLNLCMKSVVRHYSPPHTSLEKMGINWPPLIRDYAVCGLMSKAGCNGGTVKHSRPRSSNGSNWSTPGGAPCGAGALSSFSPCPFTSSSFALFYFSLSFIGFTNFLLLSIPSFSTKIVPLQFQAGGRRKRPNLGLVCCVCVICILS